LIEQDTSPQRLTVVAAGFLTVIFIKFSEASPFITTIFIQQCCKSCFIYIIL